MPYKDPARQREYQRAWVAARRAAWLDGRVCVDCGSTEALEVDHVDPSQKVHHAIWSWSAGRREAELAKCVVRCADCHHERHAVLLRRHGIKRYQAGCRCEVCRAAKAESNARYRARRESNPDARLCRPLRSRSATCPDEAPYPLNLEEAA